MSLTPSHSFITRQPQMYWLVPLFLLVVLARIGAECFGDPEHEFSLTCSEQYQDCESCVSHTILHSSCNGWCPVSGRCAGGLDDNFVQVGCAEGEVAFRDWCPVDTANPAFDSQACIAVSWEQYYCNQKVETVGCDENYVMNYCTLDNQTSTQLCNGQEIGLINKRYLPEFGGRSIGSFQKNPAGVKVKFGPGSGLYTSACYKFIYAPIANAIVCAAGDDFALKYTLALEGLSPPVPVASPVTPPGNTPPGNTPVIIHPSTFSQAPIQPTKATRQPSTSNGQLFDVSPLLISIALGWLGLAN